MEKKYLRFFKHLCLDSLKQIQMWCVPMFRNTSSTQKSLSKHSFHFVNTILMQIFICYLNERQHSYTINNTRLYHGIIEPLKVTVNIRCLFGKQEIKPFFYCTLYCTETGNFLQRISVFSLNRVIINGKNMKPPTIYAK